MSTFSPIASPPEQSHRKPDPWWRSGRLTTYVALTIALIAVVVAVAAWLRPTHESAAFSDQQSDQAKKNVCAAALIVNKAVVAKNPNLNPGDPLVQVAETANVRMALLGGGAYLRETVAAEPAAPADLAKAANSMAKTLEQIGINHIALTGTPAVLNPLQQDLNSQMTQINKVCGYWAK
jgi:hypothetical protein